MMTLNFSKYGKCQFVSRISWTKTLRVGRWLWVVSW
jgi:hypothetical protein